MDHSYIWDKTKSVLKGRLPAHAFETWFEPIKPLNINGTKLVLQVPNQFFYEWIDTHFRETIKKKALDEKGTPLNVKYTVSTEKKRITNKAVEKEYKKTFNQRIS